AGLVGIGARLGGGVDHTTERTAELGRITAGLDFELVVSLEGNVRRIDAAAEVAEVEAVHEVGGFRHGRATGGGRGAEAGVALHGAGGEQCHVGRVAGHRQLPDLDRVGDGDGCRAAEVDRVDRHAGHHELVHRNHAGVGEVDRGRGGQG